MKVIPETCHAH